MRKGDSKVTAVELLPEKEKVAREDTKITSRSGRFRGAVAREEADISIL